MAKFVADAVLDSALNYIKNNGTQLCICSAQPTDYTSAVTTYKLAIKTGLVATDYTGPTDGTVSGRKIQVNLENGLTVDSSGTAVYVAICSASVLLYVTTRTSQVLTAGNTLNAPAWQIEIADPT